MGLFGEGGSGWGIPIRPWRLGVGQQARELGWPAGRGAARPGGVRGRGRPSLQPPFALAGVGSQQPDPVTRPQDIHFH